MGTQDHRPRPTWRVVAAHANNNKEHETVNILSSAPVDPHHSIKEVLQAPAQNGFKTVIPSASTQKHLRTVFISGYSGPA